MITKLSHMSIYVLDQDRAKAFYTEKLGFEVRTDQTMEGFRWLTIAPKNQGDIEIVLMSVVPFGMMDEETAEKARDLIAKGTFGCGVLETNDCAGDYERLSAAGVEFVMPPAERPWGLEAILKDDSGNWFSLVQRPG